MNDTQDFISAQAAVLRQVGGPLAVEPVRISMPKGDEVLIRIAGVGVCHTDLVCRDGFPVPLPIVLGHEGSGTVEAVGEQVRTLKPGDRVVLSFNSCGHCGNCHDGHPSNCLQMLPLNFGGAQRVDGGQVLDGAGHPVQSMFFGQSSFGTHAVAREINAVKVGDDLPLELLGPLGCGIQTGAGAAINSLGIGPGQSLAIFGGGGVGLSALLGARAVGADRVVVIEPNAARRALALELGASHALDPHAEGDLVAAIKAATGGGATHSLDTTGLPPVIGSAIACTLPGGTVGMVGLPAPDAPVPATLLDLLSKSVTLRPITEGDADPQRFIPRMLDFHRAGKFPFDRLITRYRFDQINEALHATEKGEAIKPVLVF
ncbi:Geraniol dehydrogenase GeoA [Castellaniella defragrans 65Phen]|uniref:Geraniol dehydrogenase n=1 Tax=Castellaniella defragrans (strain DSM 12143 / CCUG 39792 / 65Phen) TaxID=1437824 RepID=GEOA_CASD6|nr:NAD(P)-dependent alcohol dehydrogenase [Castellaniella defragrans]H1ZV38.1 RecName: Full=Geraniol dehydrogenase; Short=GeDH; AltName: Full=Geraniol oxidation pathway protein A; AltName: Full=Perillyl-alcohol dehydrogenase [Castellaniella defragrans 65Phen]CCF55024.1 geraniol dehydrogenase [Castellaniella defragrans]CDM25267.1 Geraniol dehydrogenase GeoA [Castellaniella defragrans 65Phen]